MRLPLLIRKVHYWASAAIALPLLLIIATGLLLHLKKYSHWIQPAEQRGTGRVPQVSFGRVLEQVAGVPEAGVRGWEDVRRIDVRPGRGMLKVWTRSGWEVQLDAADGRVLQSAYRRSDTLEALHDGSWFHTVVKDWLFLPTGIVLLGLWATGVCLFVLPLARRRASAARR